MRLFTRLFLEAMCLPNAGQYVGIFLLFLNTPWLPEFLACIFQSIYVKIKEYIKGVANLTVR
jgi:hypothetical protein